MRLDVVVVPRAGAFRRGDWNGRELVVVQRRWFPAAVCWLIGGLALGWVGAGKLWPRSEYVPEPDQFGAIVIVGVVFLAVGVAIAVWKRSWVVDPGGGTIAYRAGFGGVRVCTAAAGLWVQVHPIRVDVRGALGWSGFAAVVHAEEGAGVVVAAGSAEEARAEAARVGEMMRVRVEGELGAGLRGVV